MLQIKRAARSHPTYKSGWFRPQWVISVSIALLALLGSQASYAQVAAEPFQTAEQVRDLPLPLRSKDLYTLNHALLIAAAREGRPLRVPLANGASAMVRNLRLTSLRGGRVFIRGDVGKYSDAVQFVVVNKAFSGSVQIPDVSTEFINAGNGLYAAVSLSDSDANESGTDVVEPTERNVELTREELLLGGDPEATVSLLVVYTSTAKADAGGSDDLEADVLQGIGRTNIALGDAGVSQIVEMVRFQENRL